MNEKEAFCSTIEDCLAKWSRRIEELKSETVQAEDRENADCARQLEALQQMGAQMRRKLEEIRASDNWESLREGAEIIRKELEETLNYPISRFK
jgi:hypothetical protein